jgi:hypothetical protein
MKLTYLLQFFGGCLKLLLQCFSGRHAINFKQPLVIVIVCSACSNQDKPLFSLLPANKTGIDFENRIQDSDSLNILDYLYFYNGGGVAIGDVNNDGLQDIYFSSNQHSNKLYLNQGDFHFKDITDEAGVQGKGNWKTGITMADVNGDGLLDIYVSEVGLYKNLHGKNELFINNGTGNNNRITFTEKAAEYGLDIEGFNTQASFFDYDKDGDLDVFIVNHSVHSTESYGDSSARSIKSDVSGDKLLRCDRDGDKIHYTEVTEAAGIYNGIIGYGLNVMIGDFNNDNWDDIYVSNDFHENDYYYINQQNGTFKELNKEAFGHESRFSMGSDVGDVNNDGWLDIITLDMLPADEKVLKSSVSDDPSDIYRYKTDKGYSNQYSKNCLQLNVGAGKEFSDISLYTGVAATDWSWSPLLADFNDDGINDLFVSNGIVRRPNDLDFVKFVSGKGFNKQLQQSRNLDDVAIEKMPAGKVSNVMYSGSTNLKFTDETNAWGFNTPSFSNGAAYADLDNDGDLDIVINNINSAAFIYQNNSKENADNHYLNIRLKGSGFNSFAYGAKVILKSKEGLQMKYLTASRGFESGSSTVLHFGTGKTQLIDSLEVIWPSGKSQLLTKVVVDTLLQIAEDNSSRSSVGLLPTDSRQPTLFTNYTDSVAIHYRHAEDDFEDFSFQRLIPHKVSTQGPKIAVADVDGDGLEDFFICGAKGQPGKLFKQQSVSGFNSISDSIFYHDRMCEDVNAIFLDADNDKDLDLYVVSGGNESLPNDPALLDRLYLNDGRGNFTKSINTLPAIFENKSVAVASDVDHDGDIDLFVGGRVMSSSYGTLPKSYLLLNSGTGVFSIADEKTAPGLAGLGMVTDAVWTDFDKDGWKDLVAVGEWMPITVFKNEKGRLRNVTKVIGFENTTGLWNTVLAADIDNDGYEELLAGNLGENSKLKATQDFPLQLYVGDLDKNGSVDQLLAVASNGKYYPFLGKEDIEKAMPSIIRKKFLDYQSMAGLPVESVFGKQLEHARKMTARMLSSVLVKNKQGKLSLSKLPAQAQWSPIFSFAAGDFNNDGKTDIISAGNFYGVLPYEGRYDAGTGNVWLSDNGSLVAMSPLQSRLTIDGEVRDIKKIVMANASHMLIFARNNNSLVFYREP